MNAIDSVAVSARGIRAKIGNVEVLHDISVGFPAGRWTSIVGPNGAGKSTLLKVLANLLPHAGEVLLLGQPLAMTTMSSACSANEISCSTLSTVLPLATN